MTVWFTLEQDGTFTATLDPVYLTVLRMVARDVRPIVVQSDVDPRADEVLDRLYPRAYSDPTEDNAERDWQQHVHDDLVAAKVAHLDRLAATLARAKETPESAIVSLDGEDVEAWMGAINDTRLILGTQLGVAPDGRIPAAARNADGGAAFDLYELLGELLEELVVAVLGFDPER